MPRLYGSPKINKEVITLRPIVDYTVHTDNSIKSEHSQELVKEMSGLKVKEGESFVSYDVVSLFTKTPITETCVMIRERLENAEMLKNSANLKVDNITELLKFVLETTYFRFGGKFTRSLV